MRNEPQVRESFVIQVGGEGSSSLGRLPLNHSQASSVTAPKLNLSSMKLFNRFRKIIMRLVFPGFPPCSATASPVAGGSRHRNSCDKPEPPKSSFSSYYSSQSHYNEAIADCIEFFNKSSSSSSLQEGFSDGRRRSDVMV